MKTLEDILENSFNQSLEITDRCIYVEYNTKILGYFLNGVHIFNGEEL